MGQQVLLDRPVPLEAWPATRRLRPGAASGGVFAGLFGAALGGGAVALHRALAGGRTAEDVWPLVLLLGFAALLTACAVAEAFAQQIVTLTPDGVRVERRGLLRRRSFAESKTAYRGVLRREIGISSDGEGPGARAFEVTLQHDDPARAVSLLATRDGARARRYAAEASERLGLPLLVDGSEGVVPLASACAPAPERRSASDPPAPPFSEAFPPPGIVLVHEAGARIARVTRPAMRLPAAAAALALPALLVYLGLVHGAPLLMPLVGGLIGAVVLLAVAWDRLTSECVVLHPDRVEVLRAHRFGASLRRVVALGDVRDVVVRRDRQGRPRLCVEGGVSLLEAGQALPPESLAWLRELVARHVAERVR